VAAGHQDPARAVERRLLRGARAGAPGDRVDRAARVVRRQRAELHGARDAVADGQDVGLAARAQVVAGQGGGMGGEGEEGLAAAEAATGDEDAELAGHGDGLVSTGPPIARRDYGSSADGRPPVRTRTGHAVRAVSAGPLADDRTASILRAGRSLVSTLELDEVLEQLLEAACDGTGARYAAIGVLAPDRHGLERFVTRGLDEERRRRIGSLPRGRGVLGVLIDDPRPLRLGRVGDHPHSFGFPPGHPPMTTFLGVPIILRGEPWGNLYLTDKAGGPFGDEDEQVAVALADFAAIAVANARAFRASEDQRVRLQQAVDALEATTDIALAVGGETDLDRILELIVKRGRALVDARAVAIGLVEGDELVLSAGAGELDLARVGRSPLGGTAAGRVLAEHRALRIDDVDAHVLPLPAAGLAAPARSALLVPLLFRGEAFGVLLAFDRRGEAGATRFSAEDERLLGAFAASAATAVATARSVAQERLREALAAEERERRRWARELHDETLQELAALSIELSGVAAATSDEATRERLERLHGDVRRQVRDLRNLITDLRPADLDELGLEAAIEALVHRAGQGGALEVGRRVELDGDGRLAPEVEAAAYRLVQEALTNVVRHAGARRAKVEVLERDGHLDLVVTDDGQGFDAAVRAAGFGLRGMRERVELLGGRLEVASGPGGTRLAAEVPVARRDGHAAA
jgi:signal transduction histidine kinase